MLVGSIVEPHSAAYVAGPLDTGRQYFENLVAGRNATVRELNQSAMREFARNLRSQLPYPVIDPGPLRVAGWTGREYAIFFLDVIAEYVRELRLMDGWEFSRGATKEFQFAIGNSIPCLDATGRRLAVEEGSRLISDAATAVDTLGLDGSVLRRHLP